MGTELCQLMTKRIRTVLSDFKLPAKDIDRVIIQVEMVSKERSFVEKLQVPDVKTYSQRNREWAESLTKEQLVQDLNNNSGPLDPIYYLEQGLIYRKAR